MKLFRFSFLGALAMVALVSSPAALIWPAFAMGTTASVESVAAEAPDLITKAVAGDIVRLAIGALAMIGIMAVAFRLARRGRHDTADDCYDDPTAAFHIPPRGPPD